MINSSIFLYKWFDCFLMSFENNSRSIKKRIWNVKMETGVFMWSWHIHYYGNKSLHIHNINIQPNKDNQWFKMFVKIYFPRVLVELALNWLLCIGSNHLVARQSAFNTKNTEKTINNLLIYDEAFFLFLSDIITINKVINLQTYFVNYVLCICTLVSFIKIILTIYEFYLHSGTVIEDFLYLSWNNLHS